MMFSFRSLLSLYLPRRATAPRGVSLSPIVKTLASFLIAFCLIVLCLNARAQNNFNFFLEDEAETGGYDVTATLSTLPVEWSLAQQENGDAYRLKLSASSVELSLQEKGKAKRLAASTGKFSPGQLLLQRRGNIWRFYLDNRLILEAEHEGLGEGKIGYRGNLSDARVQPIEEVYFDDDFMRIANDVAMEEALKNPQNGVKISSVEINETIWKTLQGAWKTTGLSENEQAQVAQSANPFVFQSDEKGVNFAVAGRDFWDDYETEVSVKPEGATAVGVAAYAQDEKNYLLFRWAQNEPSRLLAVVNGKSQILAEAPGGYEPNQWYKLRLSIIDGTMRAFVDDAEVLRARTRLFGRGLVGLYAENPDKSQNAVFDDVAIRTVPERHDDFAGKVAGRWQNIAGDWKMQNAARPADASGAYSVMGRAQWGDYTVSSDIALPASSSAGLLLHHEVGAGAYLLRITGSKAKWPYAGRVQIVKIGGGKLQVLADVKTGARFDGASHEWSFSSENGYLRAKADGQRIIDAYDTSLPTGRAGIYAQSGANGAPSLTSFIVAFPRPHRTWAKVPELYVEERQAETMGGWSTPAGLWVPANPVSTSSEKPATTEKTLWHKGAFWGDSSVKLSLPELKADERLNLLLGNGAMTFKLTLQAENDKLKATLTRATPHKNETLTKPLGEGQWPLTGEASERQIEVMRRGSYLLVRAGQGDEWTTLLAAQAYL